jgi:hypothetical protein
MEAYWGTNVKTKREEGEGITSAVYLTYNCGCEYSSGCFDMGEGFDSYCNIHKSEAMRIQKEFDIIMNEQNLLIDDVLRTVPASNGYPYDLVNNNPEVKENRLKGHEFAKYRSKFQDRIMGRNTEKELAELLKAYKDSKQ